MSVNSLFTVLLIAFLGSACTSRSAPPEIVAQRKAPPPTCNPDNLQKQMAAIATVTNGPVGAAVVNVETGEAASLRGDDRFPMQSVYKLPIAMAVLKRIDDKQLSFDQKVRVDPKDFVSRREFTIATKYPQGADISIRELLDYMISESDGTACDALMRLLGGPEVVTKFLRDIGVHNISVATYESDMFKEPSVSFQNWSTPNAMIQILKLLQSGKVLSDERRDILLSLMIKSRPGPRRIKGLLPPDTTVAHKTGTSGTIKGTTTATNDVGLITLPNGQHLAIAVFVSTTTSDEKTREGVIARIARSATDCWVEPGAKLR
jgi:beta-lactamase class A